MQAQCRQPLGRATVAPHNRFMSPRVRVFQVNAFTAQRFTGNPAAVVLEADGLDDASMYALMRELHHGDTAFVLAPDGTDHDLRVRFFTPRGETAFVGHATVAVHTVLAALGLPPRSRQKQRNGIVEVTTTPQSARPPLIGIRQGAPPLGRRLDADEIRAVLDAAHMPADALDERAPPVIVGAGGTRALYALRTGAQLDELQPDLPRLAQLSVTLGAAGHFFYSLRPAVDDCDTEARMFCPALGIDEDPVSGNAHGMLGTYLVQLGLIPARNGQARFVGAQGHHVGRPGRVAITLEMDTAAASAHAVSYVQISGTAVIIFEANVLF
jgi:PhzF family phenazine biosynthesis protein